MLCPGNLHPATPQEFMSLKVTYYPHLQFFGILFSHPGLWWGWRKDSAEVRGGVLSFPGGSLAGQTQGFSGLLERINAKANFTQ